jgi:hypothetical protein
MAEAALKQATIPLLNLLQVKNRYGVVPNAPLTAEIRGLDLKNLRAFMDGKGSAAGNLETRTGPPRRVDLNGGRVF